MPIIMIALLFMALFATTTAANCGSISPLGDEIFLLATFSSRDSLYERQLVYVSDACNEVNVTNTSGYVALVQRGECEFVEKGRNVLATNASAMIVINEENYWDVMTGYLEGDLLSFMVGHNDGDTLLNNTGSFVNVTVTDCEGNGNYIIPLAIIGSLMIFGMFVGILLECLQGFSCTATHDADDPIG